VAARFRATCFVHLRTAGDGSAQALEEVVSDSASSGAPLHVVHITSSGLGSTPRLLLMIGAARARMLDITTELYPYTAAMTSIESALFDPGWQSMLGIDYHELQWTDTGERLTAESFARYRKIGGAVILHMIPERAVLAALSSPFAMIASDGGLHNGKGHPRSSGTYARLLGRYVRGARALTLMEALRKMSLMPAQRLQDRVPMMRDKGRIRVGADADLTVFDPENVLDASTYEEPAKYSKGIRYVLVNGVPVVRDGALEPVTPGRAVRAPVP
jgi:dihydroorotase